MFYESTNLYATYWSSPPSTRVPVPPPHFLFCCQGDSPGMFNQAHSNDSLLRSPRICVFKFNIILRWKYKCLLYLANRLPIQTITILELFFFLGPYILFPFSLFFFKFWCLFSFFPFPVVFSCSVLTSIFMPVLFFSLFPLCVCFLLPFFLCLFYFRTPFLFFFLPFLFLSA